VVIQKRRIAIVDKRAPAIATPPPLVLYVELISVTSNAEIEYR
jgi:hypothetical protein